MQNVALVAIYQAGENIYKLFDKVTVVYSGKQVYFGPAHSAKAYFEEMGYECLPRQTTAEFLTAVTDPYGRFPKLGYENKVPRTADEFVAYWKASKAYEECMDEIHRYETEMNPKTAFEEFKYSAAQEKMKKMSQSSSFTVSYYHQLKACVKRGVQRLLGDRPYLVTVIFSSVVQALLTGSLFYNMQKDVASAFSRGGVLFFAVLVRNLAIRNIRKTMSNVSF